MELVAPPETSYGVGDATVGGVHEVDKEEEEEDEAQIEGKEAQMRVTATINRF